MKNLEKKIKKYAFTIFAITEVLLLGCALWLAGTQKIWIPLLAFSTLLLFATPVGKKLFSSSNNIAAFNVAITGPVCIGLLSTLYQFWSTPVLPGVTLGPFVVWAILCIACIVGLAFLASRALSYIRTSRLRKRNERELAKQQREAEERAYAERIKRENLIFAIKEKGGSPSWKDVLSLMSCIAHKNEDWNYVIEAAQFTSPEQLVTISVIKKTITWNGYAELMLEYIERVFVQSYDDTVLEKIRTQMQYFFEKIEQYDSFKGADKLLEEVKRRCPKAFSTLVENA
ncbi:MAG: hypothetical protein ACOYMZ_02910 [Minisyncoccia bacterium]